MNEGGQSRNYSLDLLRIICMLMIVFLHINSHGNLLNISDSLCVNNILISFVNALCIVAVNVYVFISGYFLVDAKFKLSKVIKIVLQVLFYSWIIGIAMIARGEMSIASEQAIRAFFPVSFQQYWFVSAYLGVYLLHPLINCALNSMTRTKHLATIVMLLFMMMVWSDLLPKSDPFSINGGYSLIWFIVLYIVAAYVRKYVDVGKIKLPGVGYIGICILMTLFWMVLFAASEKIAMLKEYKLSEFLYRYNSTPCFIASLALFIAFLKIRITGGAIQRVIRHIAPLTLGVYLIHDNPNMRSIIWGSLFKTSLIQNDLLLPFKAIIIVLSVFAGCLLIEHIRQMLFHLFDRSKWFNRLMQKSDALVWVLYDRMKRNTERKEPEP